MVYITGFLPYGVINRYIKNIATKREYQKFDNQLVINEKMAMMLALKFGESIRIQKLSMDKDTKDSYNRLIGKGNARQGLPKKDLRSVKQKFLRS